jgi:hypothetical protein
MSGGQRVLRGICQLAVVVWIAAYLTGPGAEPAAPPEPEPQAAVVRPRPEAPAPPPDPAVPEPRRVSRAEMARGAALLEGGGDFPMLRCSYEDFPSFAEYARAMLALGARFVVVRNRQIVGAVDIEGGAFVPLPPDAAFSPRARDYTDEPGLAELAREARTRFGSGAVVMMLVPRAIDAGLFGGIAGALTERNDSPDAYREIRGRYVRAPGGGVRLRVDGAVRPDGSETPIDLLFDLGALERVGAEASGRPA